MPKSYPSEFRRRVIGLYRGGRSAPSISRDFEVSRAIIYRWIDQDRIDHREKAGLSSSESVELSRARARIRELEDELAIIRKASVLFDEQERPAPKGSTR